MKGCCQREGVIPASMLASTIGDVLRMAHTLEVRRRDPTRAVEREIISLQMPLEGPEMYLERTEICWKGPGAILEGPDP